MSDLLSVVGFESEDCETIDTDTVVPRYEAIQKSKTLILGSTRQIDFDLSKDLTWYYDKSLPRHPNGMTFSVYGSDGSLIASNTYYSIGGGFVVNEATELQGENLYYKQIRKADADAARREPALKAVSASETAPASLPDPSAPAEAPVEKSVKAKSSEPPMLFSSAQSLLSLCEKNNMTIAQLVWENERHYYTDYEIKTKLLNLFNVMDQVCTILCTHQRKCSNSPSICIRAFTPVSQVTKNIFLVASGSKEGPRNCTPD